MKTDEGEISPGALIEDVAATDCAPSMKRSRQGMARINFWIDALAFLTFVICVVSGWALMRIHPDEYNTEPGLMNPDQLWGISLFVWQHLHNIIGWIFVVLVVFHLVMHRRWVFWNCLGALHPGLRGTEVKKRVRD